MPSGNIIFLNGTSSSGKTTLSYKLQELLDEPYVHMALDQFRDGLPDKYRGLNSPPGTTGSRGLNVVPCVKGDSVYTSIQFGEAGKKMLRGMRRAIAAMVESGNNVIIDDIILSDEFLDDYIRVFSGLNVTFVGVRCPLNIIEKRETARPGRFPGTAAGHLEICHAHGDYDVEVDTSIDQPQLCAQQVVSFLKQQKPAAFGRLAKSRAIID
jgi:chloramphenicol 3-O phosphotransferase